MTSLPLGWTPGRYEQDLKIKQQLFDKNHSTFPVSEKNCAGWQSNTEQMDTVVWGDVDWRGAGGFNAEHEDAEEWDRNESPATTPGSHVLSEGSSHYEGHSVRISNDPPFDDNLECWEISGPPMGYVEQNGSQAAVPPKERTDSTLVSPHVRGDDAWFGIGEYDSQQKHGPHLTQTCATPELGWGDIAAAWGVDPQDPVWSSWTGFDVDGTP
ncbi:hypothetical protein C8R45DRAFT_1088554 [Mycena sanguinolenta]|nr:hypothetical protein C8R45DRAFT_1088554 [Mycena sanguinolenta]